MLPLRVMLIAMCVSGLARGQSTAPSTPPPTSPLTLQDGRLTYTADPLGNRIPDFSHAGYRGGDAAVPAVAARRVVPPIDGDATAAIQSALDEVAALPPDADGFRGAVLLRPGRYEVAGQIRLAASGVVLRGSGVDRTTILAVGHDRRTLIRVVGQDDRTLEPAVPIASDYEPVGAMQLTLPAGHGFRAHDRVLITRPSSAAWIREIGMNDLGGDRHGPRWKEGTRDLQWDREVASVTGDTITLDAPITTAIEARLGGGVVARYAWPGRLARIGIENLRLESAVDDPNDEEHAWCAVTMEHVEDTWVRQVNLAHFAGYGVAVWESCRRVTIEDCKSLAPISEIGGGRRVAFFTNGQQVLMQRLWSEDARHDFAVGLGAAGPNAFVQCESLRSSAHSGGIDSWSSGTLCDNVRIDGNRLGWRNLGYRYAGAGWNGANSVLWNCHAAVIDCARPPGAQNWSFGAWAEFNGDGHFERSNEAARPPSLYYAQLAERIGVDAAARAHLIRWMPGTEMSPQERSAEREAAAHLPALTMSGWIDQAAVREPIDASAGDATLATVPADAAESERHPLRIINGMLVIDGAAVVGGRDEVPWWRGSTRRGELSTAVALTRFVPGREGRGYTDDLDQVVQDMVTRRSIAIEQQPPLWYDRRRDDHQRVRRMDADVVPPFYEWPYARSGRGQAWEGLSQWDLTEPNRWYWARVSGFADRAEKHGRVLIYQHYFQHSILEAGAHYADYPWRTANNINDSGFPEPPTYIGDKYVRMADAFYDLSNGHRAALHRRTIEMALDALAGQRNVIHVIGEEFTGPTAFVEFWVDNIAAWKQRTGQAPVIALAAPKEAQDAVVADPARAAAVDIIDIRYWWYATGPDDLFTLVGGISTAPRGQIGARRPAPPTFAGVASAVREYREKLPDKAVIFSARSPSDDAVGWATLVAGGSLATIRGEVDAELLKAVPELSPLPMPDGQWALADGRRFLAASVESGPLIVELPVKTADYLRTDINPATSESATRLVRLGGRTELLPAADRARVVWLRPKE